jgi:hypothetical protein
MIGKYNISSDLSYIGLPNTLSLSLSLIYNNYFLLGYNIKVKMVLATLMKHIFSTYDYAVLSTKICGEVPYK